MSIKTSSLARTVVLAGAFLATAPSVGSATPASPGKGSGCLVGDANGDYYFDAACKTHDVLKLDKDGSVQFYSYQDAGQLPAGAALPSSAIHTTTEACLNFGGSVGVLCGTIVETVTPSGAYKDSFRYH